MLPSNYHRHFFYKGLASSAVSTHESNTRTTIYFKASTTTKVLATATSSSQEISPTSPVKEPASSSLVVGGIQPTTNKGDKTTTAQTKTEQPKTGSNSFIGLRVPHIFIVYNNLNALLFCRCLLSRSFVLLCFPSLLIAEWFLFFFYKRLYFLNSPFL